MPLRAGYGRNYFDQKNQIVPATKVVAPKSAKEKQSESEYEAAKLLRKFNASNYEVAVNYDGERFVMRGTRADEGIATRSALEGKTPSMRPDRWRRAA